MLKPVNQNEIRILKSFFFLSGFPFFFLEQDGELTQCYRQSHIVGGITGAPRQKMSGLGTLKLKNH